ncbi:MAG: response regulator, partial [Deltaproteobacteria bacterium]|nr:response regulator [Deltaproteobacteria bacterium]
MKKKILVVEDHEEVISYMQATFKEFYDLVSVKHGDEAVGAATKEIPDLIIIDLVDYEVDSIEAIQEIRDNPATRTIPIIAITAGLHDTIEHGEASIDFDDFVAK